MSLVRPMADSRSAAVKHFALGLPAPFLSAMHYATVRPLRAYIRYAPWAFGKRLLWNDVVPQSFSMARIDF